VIDGWLVNGSARIGRATDGCPYSTCGRAGMLYHYAFAMIIGLARLLLVHLWCTLEVEGRKERNDIMTADWPIFSILIWLPIFGGCAGARQWRQGAAVSRWLALLIFAVLTFLLSIPLYTGL
jgi:hypothetical protein